MEKENIFFADKKNGQGKYFEKQNIFFCGREEKDEGKKKIFRKGNYTFWQGRRKKGERKGGKYLRRQIHCFAEKKKKEGKYLKKINIFSCRGGKNGGGK